MRTGKYQAMLAEAEPAWISQLAAALPLSSSLIPRLEMGRRQSRVVTSPLFRPRFCDLVLFTSMIGELSYHS